MGGITINAKILSGKGIGQILKRRYMIAVLIIALFSLFSQYLIQSALVSQQDDSRIVNIAGRQRMLSQKINKAAFGLYISRDQQTQRTYLSELDTALSLWEESHSGLIDGSETLGLPGTNSPTVQKMFEAIEPHYQTIVAAAEQIRDKANQTSYDPQTLAYDLSRIQTNEAAFLKGMDQIVFQYDFEAKQRVLKVKQIEMTILIFTLLTLALEVVFIFRPTQKQIEVAMEEIEEGKINLENLFQTAPAALFLIEVSNLGILKVNQMAKEILGLRSFEEVTLTDILRLDEEDQANLTDRLTSENNLENVELLIRSAVDQNHAVLLASNLIHFEGKDAVIVGMSNITKLKEAEEVLKRYATHDEMTGFYNRRAGMLLFEKAFERIKGTEKALSVVFLDIDGLKYVNDHYGHDEGDRYIQIISDAIRQNVSAQDCIFRYGGDEFVVVLENCDGTNALKVIDRIQAHIYQEGLRQNKPYVLHLSHGHAVLGEDVISTADVFLQRADQKMYDNKRYYKMNFKKSDL